MIRATRSLLHDRANIDHDLFDLRVRQLVLVSRHLALAVLGDVDLRRIDRENLAEFDGNEIGPTETTLYMYAPDAEKLFATIEAVLRGYPLCQNARVLIRRGGPGAKSREVRL